MFYYYIRLNFTTKLDKQDYVKQTVTYLQLGHIKIEDSRYYVKRVTKKTTQLPFRQVSIVTIQGKNVGI